MNEEVQITPEAIAQAEDCVIALQSARAVVVTTPEHYVLAAEELKALSVKAKAIEATRVKLKEPNLEACRRIDAFFKGPATFLEDARTVIKRALGVYDAEQRRLQEERERAAAEVARKERARMAEEAAKLEEQARVKRAKEEAKAAQLEADGRLEKAEALRAAAEEAEAAKVREAQATRAAAEAIPSAPVVHVEQPKVRGVSSSKVWKYRIKDISLLPREFLITEPNDKAIAAMVKALKEKTSIPGVEVYSEDIYRA